MTDFKNAMNLDELEKSLPASRQDIEKALSEGEIPNYNICGNRFVNRPDFEQYLEDSFVSKKTSSQKTLDKANEILEEEEISWNIPEGSVEEILHDALCCYGEEIANHLAYRLNELNKGDNKEFQKLQKQLKDEQAKTVKAEVQHEASQKAVKEISKAKSEALDKVKKLEEKVAELEYQLSQKDGGDVVITADEQILQESIDKDEEIKRLKAALSVAIEKKISTTYEQGAGLFALTEPEFFTDEHKALLLTLAQEKLKSMSANDSRIRLRVLLTDIVNHNEMPKEYEEFVRNLDKIDTSEKDITRSLLSLGFEEDRKNGHKVLKYKGDGRYTVTIPSTPSNNKSGVMGKSTIKKLITF
jgi:predicted RNA binding protein YcfA (HicA-like mRNA interferase family)